MKTIFQKKAYKKQLEHRLVSPDFEQSMKAIPPDKFLSISEIFLSFFIAGVLAIVSVLIVQEIIYFSLKTFASPNTQTFLSQGFPIILILCLPLPMLPYLGKKIYKFLVDYFVYSKMNEYLNLYIDEKKKEEFTANIAKVRNKFQQEINSIFNPKKIDYTALELEIKTKVIEPFHLLVHRGKPRHLRRNTSESAIDKYIKAYVAYETYRLHKKNLYFTKATIIKKITIDLYQKSHKGMNIGKLTEEINTYLSEKFPELNIINQWEKPTEKC